MFSLTEDLSKMFEAPKYTQIPNSFFDDMIPTLKEGELRVILVIMRQTLGWQKNWDRISISQLVKKTGMEHKSVCRSVLSLAKKSLILKHTIGENGKQETYYKLNVIEDKKSSNIETNSKYSDQCPKVRETSVLKTHTKERTTKENIVVVLNDIPNTWSVKLTKVEQQQLISKFGKELVDLKIMLMEQKVREKQYKPFTNCFSELMKWCQKAIVEQKAKTQDKKQNIDPVKNNPELEARHKAIAENIAKKNPELIKNHTLTIGNDGVKLFSSTKRGIYNREIAFYCIVFIKELNDWFKNRNIILNT